MKQFFSSKNGVVLPLVVILTLIMLILGMTILSIGKFERIGTGRRTQQVQALYLAEAGAYRAYALLSGGTTPSWYGVAQTLGSGTYIVQEDEDGHIVSTGTRGNIHQTVRLELQRSGGGISIFSDGIFGSTSVTITGSSNLTVWCMLPRVPVVTVSLSVEKGSRTLNNSFAIFMRNSP
jgi:hypothetical protein